MAGIMKNIKFAVDYMLNMADYIIAWVNKTGQGIIRKLTGGFDPNFNQNIDNTVNPNGQPQSDAEFVANIEKFVKGKPEETFFKDNPNFFKELAAKAVALKNDSSTPVANPDFLPRTIQITMYQNVIYCDDSSSMKREKRWESQAKLVNRIAHITTRILPQGEGVGLRFINQEVEGSTSLSFEKIGEILQKVTWGGDTPIGTNLKSKILQPLVYDKLNTKLERPLLISIITDGMPEPEARSTLVQAIVECGDRLEAASPPLPRNTVKFVIGQVGTNNAAKKFLQEIADEKKIQDVIFVVTGEMDTQASKFEKDWDLDKWLIETLYSVFESKKTL